MAAFTEDQIRLLGAAFDHVHSCMAGFTVALNDHAERLTALGLLLAEQGLITAEQWEAATAQVAMQAGLADEARRRRRQDVTEEDITREILRGDAEAGERRRREEEDTES